MLAKETYRALKDEALPLPSSPCDLSARLQGQWPSWAGRGRVSEGGREGGRESANHSEKSVARYIYYIKSL